MSNIPAVLFTFDDANASDYSEAFPYMQSKGTGMVGTSYIIDNKIGTAGRLTEANLAEMYAAGWDIATHSDQDLTELADEAAQEAEISSQVSYVDGLGYTRASHHFAYPFGNYDADTLTAMGNLGMLTGRTGNIGNGKMSDFTWYELPCMVVMQLNSGTTLTQAQAMVSECKCYGKVGIICLHTLVESNPAFNDWLISDFQALVDHVYDNKIPTLTISQLYGLASAPLTYTNPWYTA